jgi:hypothetical protein
LPLIVAPINWSIELEPISPILCVVWPFPHLDAPSGRIGFKKSTLPLIARKTSRDDGLGLINDILDSGPSSANGDIQPWHHAVHVPNSGRSVRGRRNYLIASRVEICTPYAIPVAPKHRNLLPALRLPKTCCLVVGGGHYFAAQDSLREWHYLLRRRPRRLILEQIPSYDLQQRK